MTGIRESKDVYCGCESKQFEAVWLIRAVILISAICFLLLWLLIASPSSTDANLVNEAVDSRNGSTASNFESNEVKK